MGNLSMNKVNYGDDDEHTGTDVSDCVSLFNQAWKT